MNRVQDSWADAYRMFFIASPALISIWLTYVLVDGLDVEDPDNWGDRLLLIPVAAVIGYAASVVIAHFFDRRKAKESDIAQYTPHTLQHAQGVTCWYKEGKLHRLDGPAVEGADGYKEWWVNGKPHRLDGPAVEWADGTKHWYRDGLRHRLDGPATERPDGSRMWWVNGKPHRLDGPAVEWIKAEAKEVTTEVAA